MLEKRLRDEQVKARKGVKDAIQGPIVNAVTPCASHSWSYMCAGPDWVMPDGFCGMIVTLDVTALKAKRPDVLFDHAMGPRNVYVGSETSKKMAKGIGTSLKSDSPWRAAEDEAADTLEVRLGVGTR